MRAPAYARRLAALGLGALVLAGCGSSADDVRSLVAVNVRLGDGVAVDQVELTVTPASGAAVVQTFAWSDASAGVLYAGVFVPAGIKGHAELRGRGLLAGSPVAEASASIELAAGALVGPVALVLAPSGPGHADAGSPADGGGDVGAGADAGADDAGEPAAPDAGEDVPADLAPDAAADAPPDLAVDTTPDVMPDLPPDAPPEPPSLAHCQVFIHVEGACNTQSGENDWAVPSVKFSPDGKHFVSGGQDGRGKVWKVTEAGLEPDGRVYGGSGSMRVDFSPDGVYLAVSTRNGPLTLIEFARNAMVGDFIGHTGQVYAIAFSGDSKSLASVDDGGTVKLWDVASRVATKTLKLPAAGYDIALAPTGPPGTLWGAVALSTGGVVLLDFKAEPVVMVPISVGGSDIAARAVAFAPDGASLAIGTGGTGTGELSIWDISNKQQVAKLGAPVYTSAIQDAFDVAFTRDGRFVAMAWARQGGVVLTSSTQVPRRLGGSVIPEWIPISVAISPDSRVVAAGEYRCGKILYCKD